VQEIKYNQKSKSTLKLMHLVKSIK